MLKLADFINDTAALLEEELPALLPAEKGDARILAEAMRYSVMNGGKRLRPVLFCATMQAFGQDFRPYLPYAAAIEMIHCYSLIHDDLPAMDDDELRRGKPTCHMVYGEAMAILAGDALLSLAGEILARPLNNQPPAQQLSAMRLIMGSALHMVEGQAIELSSNDFIAEAKQGENIIDTQKLQIIYEAKTSALFRAAVVGAACLCGATDAEKEQLKIYCQKLGLAFQIADDILDISGDPQLVGKSLSDRDNNKMTYPALLGLEAARQEAQKAAQAAKDALLPLEKEHNSVNILRLFPDYFALRDR